jgi:hypothetical protein
MKKPKPLTQKQIDELHNKYWFERVHPKPGDQGSETRRQAWILNRRTFIDAYLAGRRAGRKERAS